MTKFARYLVTRIFPAIVATGIALTAFSFPSQVRGAAIDPVLRTQVETNGLVSVLIDLNGSVSLADMQNPATLAARREALGQQSTRVVTDLSADHITGSFRSNGLGQATVAVNARGLDRLAAHADVKSVQHDVTETMRETVSDRDGRLSAIKARVRRDGQASVQIYYLDRPSEIRSLTIEDLTVLKQAENVRTAYLIDWSPSGVRVDPVALTRARATGYAYVMIGLYPENDYSPRQGALPAEEWLRQAANIAARFERAFPGVELHLYPGFPIAAAPKLPLSFLENPPSGVMGISINGQSTAFLDQSTAMINMTSAWSSGYDGTGQIVAILDTGVQKSHQFFGGRVLYEACFGSNATTIDNIEYVTVCPSPNPSGDSPGINFHPNSGEAPELAGNWGHGTHVAGIAAGRNT